MTATERVLSRVNARQVRPGEYRAKCPVHTGKSNDSLSILQSDDRVLIYCFKGCDYHSILNALGLSSGAELFDSTRTHSNPVHHRQAKARRDLEHWANGYLTIVCKSLRDLESTIQVAASSLAQYENEPTNPHAEEPWDVLSKAYKRRSDLEYQFDILNNGSLSQKLQLWREVSS